jgi:hypothetical protein
MTQTPIIYLETGDDISQVISRLGRVKSTVVVIVVPKGAVLMHSPLNLKILKRYLDTQGRTASIAIADKIGSTFAEQAGFELASPATSVRSLAEDEETNFDDEFTPPEISLEDDVEVDDSEIEVPSTSFFVKRGLGVAHGQPSPLLVRPPLLTNFKLRLSRQHKIALLLVGLGLVILGSVGYFVLPKATVSLEVQAEPFKKQFGLVVADAQDLQAVGANILTGRFLEVSRENVATFSATGEQNNGKKAEGKITVINHTGSIAGLLANTRFQAANGLVFRLKNEVLVSPARNRVPGRAVVDAIADEGGTKYQLPAGTKLSIPGLAANARELVYGEVQAVFTGATDEITKVVSQADIDKAKEEAAKNVFAAAETELQGQLKRNEELVPSFIQNDVIDAIASVAAGSTEDQFEIRVQSRSWVIAIPKGHLQEAIANAAANEVPEGKQITKRTAETAKLDVLEGNFLTHRINLAIIVDGRVGPVLDTEAIVTRLVNQPISAGKTQLQGLTNVASSSIEIWPKWMTRIPLLRNNIKVDVVYLGE